MLEVMVYDTEKEVYIYKQSFKKLSLDCFARDLNTAYWQTAATEEDEQEVP